MIWKCGAQHYAWNIKENGAQQFHRDYLDFLLLLYQDKR
jgi:hypothetical protein